MIFGRGRGKERNWLLNGLGGLVFSFSLPGFSIALSVHFHKAMRKLSKVGKLAETRFTTMSNLCSILLEGWWHGFQLPVFLPSHGMSLPPTSIEYCSMFIITIWRPSRWCMNGCIHTLSSRATGFDRKSLVPMRGWWLLVVRVNRENCQILNVQQSFLYYKVSLVPYQKSLIHWYLCLLLRKDWCWNYSGETIPLSAKHSMPDLAWYVDISITVAIDFAWPTAWPITLLNFFLFPTVS